MSQVCEMMKLYVATGHIGEVMVFDQDTGQIGVAYAVWQKPQRQPRKQGFHIFVSYCPGCGTPQNLSWKHGPVGLFCTMAGVPVRETVDAAVRAFGEEP